MRRGEIRWYKFNHPDKKRPVLVLTRSAIIEHLGEVTVAPITSVVRDIPSEVSLGKGEGMQRDCVVNCDHLQTVPKDKLGGLITTLPQGKMMDVRRAVAFALEL